MPPTKNSSFLSPSLIDPVPTNANPSAQSRDANSDAENRDAWRKLIDYQLIEWGWNSDEIEDEGVDPPSRAVVQLAIQVAEKLRDAGYSPPNSVVPDANGGIVFERRENNITEVFHIWDDGEIEYQRFEGTRLAERRPM